MKELYKIYTDNELWDDTSCPFGTQVLNREAYDINMGELDIHKLERQLRDSNIDYRSTNLCNEQNNLMIDMSWTDDDDPYNSTYEVMTCIYTYDGYIYNVKVSWIDGCFGFTMTREPQFNKNYI